MKLPASAQRDLRRAVPQLLSRARALAGLPPGDAEKLGLRELHRFRDLVSELHQGLVGERQLAASATYEQRAHLAAYLVWWWPQSYARVRAALELAPLPFEQAPRSGPIRLLELGAGPGPGALAILDWLAEKKLRAEALLLDESELALGEAAALANGRALKTESFDLAAAGDLSKSPAAAGLASLPASAQGRFELICAANLLSELPGGVEAKAAWLRALADEKLSGDGALILIEPGLRETGRALLELRDRLIDARHGEAKAEEGDPAGARSAPGRLRALAPCLTQAPCPALLHPRDWCTAEIAWEAPPHLLQLSRELKLHAEAPLSFAPLVAAKQVPPPPEHLWRVVGVPPEEKGKKRLFVCAQPGRLPVARLDRDARAESVAFDEARRGDLLRLAGLREKGDGLRLARESECAAASRAELAGAGPPEARSAKPEGGVEPPADRS